LHEFINGKEINPNTRAQKSKSQLWFVAVVVFAVLIARSYSFFLLSFSFVLSEIGFSGFSVFWNI